MRRRLAGPFAGPLAAVVLAVPAALLPAADAVAVPADKPQVLQAWTQPELSSYQAWDAARRNQAAWRAYAFDWTTDYCSGAPENPLGFPFKDACARHDFGYRNYKAAGAFPANKPRLDKAFHADMNRVCATYSASLRTRCQGVAWIYYQAVVVGGRSSGPSVAPHGSPLA
ncbi:phospholipase [Streptomyces sp. NPDC093546]|uniref:phospholipase n=1 Tax=Streptomyces sp. NPDC093546 TaxID=3366040 RepID=UPI003820702B